MKRPTRGSGAPPTDTKLSGTLDAPANGRPSSALPLEREVGKAARSLTAAVRKEPQPAPRGAEYPTEDRHFQVISALAEVSRAPTQATTMAAGNLRDEQELLRLQPIIERIASTQKRPHILVAGFDADRVLRTVSASKLRRALEDLGAVFIERPQDAETPESLAKFLDDHYASDQGSIDAALAPPPPITVLKDHDTTPYLRPRPEGRSRGGPVPSRAVQQGP